MFTDLLYHAGNARHAATARIVNYSLNSSFTNSLENDPKPRKWLKQAIPGNRQKTRAGFAGSDRPENRKKCFLRLSAQKIFIQKNRLSALPREAVPGPGSEAVPAAPLVPAAVPDP